MEYVDPEPANDVTDPLSAVTETAGNFLDRNCSLGQVGQGQNRRIDLLAAEVAFMLQAFSGR